MSNSSLWLIDRTLLVATTPDQRGPGSKSNEWILHILLISKAGASPSDSLVSYSLHSLVGVLPLCRDTVTVFYSPGRLGFVGYLMLNPIYHIIYMIC